MAPGVGGIRYSTLVTGLKIALPLVGLVILSTLFLLSEPPDPDRALPYAEVDVAQLARDLRLTQPRFAGVLEDGREVTLIAGAATPEFDDAGTGRAVLFRDLTGRIALADGDVLSILAAQGLVDMAAQQARLGGDVRAETQGGLTFSAAELTLDLGALGLGTDTPVEVTAPGLTLDAGAMEIRGPDGEAVLSFTGGVRLLYLAQE